MEEFFKRNLELLYGRCESSWMGAIVASMESERELILSDVTLGRPNLDTGSRFARELLGIVEIDAAQLGVLLYRIERGIFLREPGHPVLPFLAQLMRFRTGMEIYYSSEIGPRFWVVHGIGIVIGPRHRIGSDFMIYQGVTLGQKHIYSSEEHLTIGDGCIFFANASALGALTLGNNVKVAAGAVLLSDAVNDSTYAGVPARKVR